MKFQISKSLFGLLSIVITFVILHLPTISNPYHYDAIVWVAQSKYFSQTGLFIIPPEDFGHPYFMLWVLALFYRIFDETVLVSHLIMIAFAIIALIGTYLIGKELFNEKIALISTAFLAFQPWFFVVSNWVYFDIPLTAMFTIAVYFFIKAVKTEKLGFYLLFTLFGSIAALTKEPGILVTLIPILFLGIKRKFKLKYLIFLTPILATIFFYTWHFITTGYIFHSAIQVGILLPTNLKNLFLLGRNLTTNILFHFIQNGNFISFLLITYITFYKKYRNIFFIIAILFFLLAPYSFLLMAPDKIFYPFLLLFDMIFVFWVIKVPKIKDEYKILVIWIAVILFHVFFEQISFRYGLPMLPAFALLLASSVQKINKRGIILLIIFTLLGLQVFNYSNYYSQRDLIYVNVFNYFVNKSPQSVMVAYPIASPAVLGVGNIDSRPLDRINPVLTPETKEEFEQIKPQYLVLDHRSIPSGYDYIKEIVKTNTPVAVFTKEIDWITYYGIKKVFINTISIYKFY